MWKGFMGICCQIIECNKFMDLGFRNKWKSKERLWVKKCALFNEFLTTMAKKIEEVDIEYMWSIFLLKSLWYVYVHLKYLSFLTNPVNLTLKCLCFRLLIVGVCS
jgi:hypothetical protein